MLSLVLSQEQNVVTGTFSGEIPAGIGAPISMTGSFDAVRTLHIQGSQPFAYGDFNCVGCQTGIAFTNWTTVADDAGMSMTGVFHLTLVFRTTNAYPDNWEIQAEIVSLTRQST
jgi:hypothetical protein